MQFMTNRIAIKSFQKLTNLIMIKFKVQTSCQMRVFPNPINNTVLFLKIKILLPNKNMKKCQ